MFELERAISDWRREMQCRGIESAETLDELENHLREDLEAHVRSGMEIQGAFEAARADMGHSESLGLEFKKIRLTELLRELKNALLSIIGLPNYNLITNMNTSFPTPNVEARWASYVKAGTFLAPSL